MSITIDSPAEEIRFPYEDTHATPAASTGALYFKTDGLPYVKNAATTEYDLTSDVGPVASGDGAPGTTPTYLFQRYVDTTADTAYISVGTASSADWKAATT